MSLLIAALMSASLIRCVVIAKSLNHANEQRVIAYGMAKAKVEELQGLKYDKLIASDFRPERDIAFTHLGGGGHLPLTCTRHTRIYTRNSPDRKEVLTQVQWKYRGKFFREKAIAVLYPK